MNEGVWLGWKGPAVYRQIAKNEALGLDDFCAFCVAPASLGAHVQRPVPVRACRNTAGVYTKQTPFTSSPGVHHGRSAHPCPDPCRPADLCFCKGRFPGCTVDLFRRYPERRYQESSCVQLGCCSSPRRSSCRCSLSCLTSFNRPSLLGLLLFVGAILPALYFCYYFSLPLVAAARIHTSKA